MVLIISHTHLNQIILASDAEFVFLWGISGEIPAIEPILDRFLDGIDLVHAGVRLGTGNVFPELVLVKQDWSMIDAPETISSSNWPCQKFL